tara:strand:+ start:2099 stop:2791 length:693 start_codon:yes stop_codon:yes gene_type:complete
MTMTMLRSRALPLVLLAACASSGGTPESETAGGAGVPEAPPSMECLPDVPQPTRAEFTESMRFAWRLSEDAFELPDPMPPSPDSDTAEVQAWTDGQMHEWLQRKNQLVEAARAELNQAAEENHAQRTMAGGLVGVLYEDVARVLLRVPLPSDLRNEEPVIVDAFRDVVDAQARPYLEHARRAYAACAANARPHDELQPWEHFCSARRALLPLTRSEAEAEGTTVEVIAPE